mmetsp:Transcript_10186/g.20276  ORF Transcript_10186/g.20276 Transcript_10186/m.20276 type:complete len:535 (-) Transcript_10186:20-1624(-)
MNTQLLLVVCALMTVRSLQFDPFSSWFVDQHKETEGPIPVTITGVIPQYVTGDLYRLGPSITSTLKKNYTNFLDGFGRVTRWSIDGEQQQATFQSRMIRSLQFNSSDDGTSIVRHITQQVTAPKTRAGPLSIENMDNTDVALYPLNPNAIVTVTDFASANVIDRETLETIGTLQYDDSECPECDGATFSGSHNGFWSNPDTGEEEIVNWIGKKHVGGFEIMIYRLSRSTLKRKVVGTLSLRWQPFSIHAIAVTNNYATLVLGRVELDFLKTGVTLCLTCSAEDRLKEKDGKVFVFELGNDKAPETAPKLEMDVPKEEAYFVFHFINAYLENDGDELTLEFCAYDSMDGVLGDFILGDVQNMQNPEVRDTMPYNCDALRRTTVNLKKGKITSTEDIPVMDSTGKSYRMELVSINPAFWGKRACIGYGFTMHAGEKARFEDLAIVKVNLCEEAKEGKGNIQMYHEEAMYTGEPIFVPDPAGSEEDSGCLLVVGKEGETGNTKLLILDAKSMQVVATVQAPFPTAYEFHGSFLTDNK